MLMLPYYTLVKSVTKAKAAGISNVQMKGTQPDRSTVQRERAEQQQQQHLLRDKLGCTQGFRA